MTITDVRPRAQELLERMSPTMYREAYKRGMSLSAYLESQDPSEGYNDGLDSFSRMLKLAGIKTRSVPEAGFFADRFEAFDRSDYTRSLVPEWISRQWRRVAMTTNRASYTSDDNVPGSIMHPYVDAAHIRAKLLAPAIPLANLIAQTSPIDSDSYRAYYLTDDPANQRPVRVGEFGEVPLAKLVGGEHTITLKKYGRALEVSYETLRRMPIDKVAYHIARMAVQAETDKVAAVIDVLVNGDGNAGTAATTYNLTALDSGATAGTLTLKGWMRFKMKFASPYILDTALAQEDIALQMFLLNAGTANIPMVNIQNQTGQAAFKPINPGLGDGVALGWTSDAPANDIVGVDTRLACERVVEIGANITEVDKYVSRQSQRLVMTEVEGYCVFDQLATKVLVVNA